MATMKTKAELIFDEWEKETPTLCPSCRRPYHGSTELEYVCESCGAHHYVDEFYVCCKVDSQKVLVSLA